MGRRDHDDRPSIEVWGAPEPADDAPTRVEVTPRRPPWRTIGVLALVAVVLGALLMLDGPGPSGDDATDEAAEERTTTTRTRQTTSSTTPSSSTTTSTLPPGPVLGRTVGATVAFVSGGPGAGLPYVDLDTGAMGELDLGDGEAWSAVAVRGGVVVPTMRGVQYVPLTGEPVDLHQGPALVVSSGTPDAVWVLEGRGPSPAAARLVDLSGRLLVGPLQPAGWVSHGAPDGVVHRRGGRVYLTDEDGTRAVGVGEVFSRSGRWLGLETCDEIGRCALERIDLVSLERTSYGPSAGDGSPWWVEPSPDGELAVVVVATDPTGPELRVVEAGGAVRWDGEHPTIAASDAAWLPDGSGFVVLDEGQVRGLLVAVPVDGVVVEPLPIPSGRSAERVLVIPH